MFLIQVDSTQDISSQDQCSIVVRYICDDLVHERLLAVIKCHDSSGERFKNMVMNVLKSKNINIKTCVGISTDGAAKMRGEYKGLSAWLTIENPILISVWCYAHVLNLAMVDTLSSEISALTLFGTLNKVAGFIKDSYVRMDIWISNLSNSDKRRLNLIGETRWWAKEAALSKIFGNIEDTEKSLFVDLISALEKIESDSRSKSDARLNAQSYREMFLKYETILTAFIFKYIFNVTTPLSKYLQTSGLEILKAFNMVKTSINKLTNLREEFIVIKKKADEFVDWMNLQLEDRKCESIVESSLPKIRTRRKKLLPRENNRD